MMSWPRLTRSGADRPASFRIAAKRSMARLLEHANGAPGQGLKGIRLTLAGSPASRRARARASAGLSLTPFSMTYSKVMRRALWAPG